MPVVHLDANCHPGRARSDNVVARNQVTDVRFGSVADVATSHGVSLLRASCWHFPRI